MKSDLSVGLEQGVGAGSLCAKGRAGELFARGKMVRLWSEVARGL